tara:strand:+ start:1217 stop:1516 length:300 start_codon:yes stop_codon:yes gene_type:complete
MRLFRGNMKEKKEEIKVITKEWKNVSKHDSYETADKRRKLLLSQNKGNENFLVKIKRCGPAGNNYVVKTHTEEKVKESKYAKKKREKAKREHKRKKQDG